MITDYVCIKDGFIIYTDVAIDVVVDKFYRKFEDELRQGIIFRINSFFSLNSWDYGQDLNAQDLIKQLSDIKEISSTDVNFITDNESNSGQTIVARFYEIIRPATITINFVYE